MRACLLSEIGSVYGFRCAGLAQQLFNHYNGYLVRFMPYFSWFALWVSLSSWATAYIKEYIYTIAIPILSRPSLPAITPCSLSRSTRACWTANKLARVYPSLVSRDLCFTSGKAGSFHSQRIGGRSRSGDAACFDVVVQGSVPDLVGTASLQWSWCHRHRAGACR